MAESDAAQGHSLSLQDELTCSICLELFKDPVTLPCLHSFCVSCIQGMHQSIVQNSMGLHCPQCRKFATLPNGSFEELPKNFNLTSIVRKFQQQQERREPLQEDKGNKESTCQRHNKDVGHYCISCSVFVCADCQSDHTLCNVDSIQNAHVKCMGKLDCVMLPKLRQLCDFLEEKTGSLKEEHQLLTASTNSVCDEVYRLFDELKQSLDVKKAEIISEVRLKEQTFVEDYQSEMKSIKLQLEEAKNRLSKAQSIRACDVVSGLQEFAVFSSSNIPDSSDPMVATQRSKRAVKEEVSFVVGLSTAIRNIKAEVASLSLDLNDEIENTATTPTINTGIDTAFTTDMPFDPHHYMWRPRHPPPIGHHGHHPPPHRGCHRPPHPHFERFARRGRRGRWM